MTSYSVISLQVTTLILNIEENSNINGSNTVTTSYDFWLYKAKKYSYFVALNNLITFTSISKLFSATWEHHETIILSN